VHLEAVGLQTLGHHRGGPVLLMGQLRVLMQEAVELLLLRAHAGQTGKHSRRGG
jgi:hypothetical protein